MSFYALLRTGLEGPMTEKITSETRRTRTRFLPDNIYDAIRFMKQSEFMTAILGEENKDKLVDRKLAAAERSPKELGTRIKTSEIIYHHEVTNQFLWGKF